MDLLLNLLQNQKLEQLNIKKKGCLKKSYVFDGQYLFVKYQEIQVTDYIVQLSIYQLVLEPVPAT